MKFTKFLFVISFLIVCLSFGCSKDEEDQKAAADLIGTVQLYDQDGISISNSAMTISTESSIASATTDSMGNFKFRNLAFGNYWFEFEKDGFGHYKYFFAHEQTEYSNVIPDILNISERSTAEMVSLELSQQSDGIVIKVVSNPAAAINNKRYFHTFYHSESTVSYSEFTTFETRQLSFSPSKNYFKSFDFFYDSGFESGQDIFIAVYTTSAYDNSYYDPGIGTTIFPNINPATVAAVSFILP